MATAREQAREAARQAWAHSPDTDITMRQVNLHVAADAASDVWEPLLRRVVGALADAYADVDGWQAEAMAILTDDTINPVVGVYDPDTGKWVWRSDDGDT